ATNIVIYCWRAHTTPETGQSGSPGRIVGDLFRCSRASISRVARVESAGLLVPDHRSLILRSSRFSEPRLAGGGSLVAMPLDTELHKAANKGDIQGVRDLVESGAVDVNEKGAQDRTALHRAAGANHVGIIHYLLQSGAPVDCVDRCLRTPLHWAAISGHLDATQLLLDSGGDLRRKTMSGMNPLMCAVQQRWHRVAEAILEWSAGCGADRDEDQDQNEEGGHTPSPAELCSTTDMEGKSAVVYAKEHSDIPMQKLLKSYAPKKPSASCCCCCGGRAKEQQLSAVVGPTSEGDVGGGRGTASGVGVNGAGAAGRTKSASVGGGSGGGRRGWLLGVCCCFTRCSGTPDAQSISNSGSSGSRSGVPSGATVRDAAPSNVRSPATIAAGTVGGKAAEVRHGGTVTESGGVGRSVGGVRSNKAIGGDLSLSASSQASRVKTNKSTGINGTLVMNDQAFSNRKINAQPVRESLRATVHKDKRTGSGGGKGAKQSSSSSSSS
ncbi:unnamed protein product, partial [Scytosiphon promiscuus]